MDAMSGVRRTAFSFLVLLASCNETLTTQRDAGTEGEPSESIPCDVQQILVNVCQNCHTDPPINTAPMPLVTYADTQAPAVSEPSEKVWERMMARIHDEEDPMPPPSSGFSLTSDQLETLDAWFVRGAPARETQGCDGEDAGTAYPDAGPIEIGPDALPCTPSETFLAHREGSEEGYQVQSSGNAYICFAFRSPFLANTQATAWAPVIDDERVVHHYILYGTSTPQTEGSVGPCDMPEDAKFLMGWAPGADNWVMPDDIGAELPGSDEWLILQIHYWNTVGYENVSDRSGIALCTTDTPRTYEAGIVWLGSTDIYLPPHSSNVTVTGECSSSRTAILPQSLYILGTGPHMHQLGQRITTTILRGGDEDQAETLIDIEHWDFNSQAMYRLSPPAEIHPGDSLITRCVYDNPGDQAVAIGERTEDEMCFNFLMVYPINGATDESRYCL